MQKELVALISTLALAGCGGGGGGGGGDDEGKHGGSLNVFSNTSTLTIEGSSTHSTYASIDISSTGTSSKEVFYGVFEPKGNLLDAANLYFTSETAGYVDLQFYPGYQIGDGTSQGEVVIAFCYDELCNSHVSGSPITVNTQYQVSLDETISVADDTIALQSTLNAKDLTNDIIKRSIAYRGTNIDQIIPKLSYSHTVTNHVTLAAGQHDQLLLQADMKLPTALGEGTHSEDITINACYDVDCAYPINGSPLVISASHEVNPALFGPDSTIPVGSRIDLPHNVLHAEHIPALDVIVMTSNHPTNAAYVYDIQANQSRTYPLDHEPTDLAIDKLAKQGRIVIGHANNISVIDYDDRPIATVDNYRSIAGSPSVIVKRDQVYAAIHASEGLIEILDLATQTSQLSDRYYSDLELMTWHPKGDSIFTVSPSDSHYSKAVSRIPIEPDFTPYEVADRYYAEEYLTGENFWFSRTGDQIYTSLGSIFNISAHDSSISYQGEFPRIDYDTYNSGYFSTAPLLDLVARNNQLMVVDATPVNTIRILDKTTLQVVTTYPATQHTSDGESVDDRPLHAFFSDQGHVYSIKEAWHYPANPQFSLTRLD